MKISNCTRVQMNKVDGNGRFRFAKLEFSRTISEALKDRVEYIQDEKAVEIIYSIYIRFVSKSQSVTFNLKYSWENQEWSASLDKIIHFCIPNALLNSGNNNNNNLMFNVHLHESWSWFATKNHFKMQFTFQWQGVAVGKMILFTIFSVTFFKSILHLIFVTLTFRSLTPSKFRLHINNKVKEGKDNNKN